MLTPWKDNGLSEPTFVELADAVNELCEGWTCFRVVAASQGLSWNEALRPTIPELFSDDSTRPDGLREDSAFSYISVKSDRDVMQCFLWRHERAYC